MSHPFLGWRYRFAFNNWNEEMNVPAMTCVILMKLQLKMCFFLCVIYHHFNDCNQYRHLCNFNFTLKCLFNSLNQINSGAQVQTQFNCLLDLMRRSFCVYECNVLKSGNHLFGRLQN